MTKNKWFLNGGRGSGRTIRLLCETYENKIAKLQHIIDTLQGYLDKDIEYDMDKTIQEQKIKIAELEVQIEKMKCCGNCKNLKGRFDSKTNINILYCSDSDMKQIEVGFQMCCCKWEIKEND